MAILASFGKMFFLQPQLDPFTEHFLNFLFQNPVLRRSQGRILLDNRFGGSPHLLENIRVTDQITDIQLRQSMLACAEDFTGTAQLQILLGNHKAVLGAAHDFISFLRDLTVTAGNQNTIRLRTAPADTPAQLMQLRKPGAAVADRRSLSISSLTAESLAI